MISAFGGGMLGGAHLSHQPESAGQTDGPPLLVKKTSWEHHHIVFLGPLFLYTRGIHTPQ